MDEMTALFSSSVLIYVFFRWYYRMADRTCITDASLVAPLWVLGGSLVAPWRFLGGSGVAPWSLVAPW